MSMMDLAKKSYHENKIKKMLYENTQEIADIFSMIFQRHGIGKLCISEGFKENAIGKIFCKEIFPKTAFAKTEKKLEMLTEKEQKSCVDGGLECKITDTNLRKLIGMQKEKLAGLPEVLNTLENCYSTLYIVGRGEFREEIWNYFSQNKNITLENIEERQLEAKDKKFILHKTCNGDEMIVFTDLYEERPVVDESGNGFQTFYFLRYYCNDIKSTENMQDVDKHIIPKLLADDVRILKIYVPDIQRIAKKKKVERSLLYWNVLRHWNPEKFSKQRRKIEHTEFLKEEIGGLSNDNSKGYSLMYGNGTYMNFDNGFRRTEGNPVGDVPQIYFFGPCFIRGLNCSDKDTIPSKVQEKIGESYRILNYGSEFQTCCYIMRTLTYKRGDIVVIFSPETYNVRREEQKGVETIDLTDVYNQINDLDKHVFDLLVHFDGCVQERIVDAVFRKLKDMQKNTQSENIDGEKNIHFGIYPKRAPELCFCKDDAFVKWIETCKSKFPYREGNTRGAIIMNCNPFTNGHRYLIEKASSQVDELFIFVVQENKSFFPFQDRMELVELGTRDIGNVIVAASGNYMISSMTLPGYFNKEQLQDTYLDASSDLTLFAQIAQALNITIRFAGEEPIDRFTQMYNQNMRKILPEYGIQFEEIPRKTDGDTVISASRVRAALKDKDFELIEKLVPSSTYSYLLSRFGKAGD